MGRRSRTSGEASGAHVPGLALIRVLFPDADRTPGQVGLTRPRVGCLLMTAVGTWVGHRGVVVWRLGRTTPEEHVLHDTCAFSACDQPAHAAIRAAFCRCVIRPRQRQCPTAACERDLGGLWMREDVCPLLGGGREQFKAELIVSASSQPSTTPRIAPSESVRVRSPRRPRSCPDAHRRTAWPPRPPRSPSPPGTQPCRPRPC